MVTKVETAGASDVRTFLIADVRGYTRFTVDRGDEAAARLATRFAELTGEVVASRGGEVIELRGDEALAVFSSTRQALWAATDLQRRFALETTIDGSLPLKVGIGLDAGEAIPVAGGYRGAALNMAARLCSLAGPGEVLASDGVIHLARKLDGLVYTDRGAAQLKGFAEPVSIYGVTAGNEDPEGALIAESAGGEAQREQPLPIGGYLGALSANPLVGREVELERALRAVDSAAAGTGKLLLLVGEPGAGKTRLAQEITLTLRDREFAIAAGRCYEPQSTVPFYPFVEALASLYAVAPASTRAEVPRKWSDLARLLPSLGLPVAETSGQDQQRLFWSITGFIQEIAREAPVALLLDDLHWADAASIELLQHLARHTSAGPVLLLATYRDVEVNRQHPLEGALRDLQREGLTERIDVRRLPREETRGLIASVMGEEEVSEEFAELVYGRTEGNPFFVQQVLRVLVERGDIFRRDGLWDRRAIEEIDIPESVRSVVGQRLSRLPEDTQEILREASVLGQSILFDDLLAMTGRPEADLEHKLDEAARAGLIQSADGETYRFDHALTQGVLYLELPPRRRRKLHLAAGEAIEALPERRRQGRVAELAWHFLQANDAERALRYVLLAGDEAETVFAHSDAAFQYRTAIELARDVEDRAREAKAREKLGAVLHLHGRPAAALEEYEAAADVYRTLGDFEGELRATAGIGWTLFELGRREEGIERLMPFLARWEEQGTPSSAAASLHIAVANLHWHAGRNAEGLPIIERAIQLAATAGDDRLLGLAESRRALMVDDPAESLAAYNRAIPLSEAAGDLQSLARSLNNRSIAHYELNQRDLSTADVVRQLEVARRLGNPADVVWALTNLMWDEGEDWQSVQPLIDEIVSLGPLVRGTRSSGQFARALWRQVIMGAAPVSEMEKLVDEGQATGDHSLWIVSELILSQWNLFLEQYQPARERLTRILADPDIESQVRIPSEIVLARVYLAIGDVVAAEDLLARGDAQGRGVDDSESHARRTGVLAIVRGTQERWEEAQLLLEETVTFFQRRRQVFDVATLLYDYGMMLARAGDIAAARERLQDALAIYQRLGARLYVETTERALTRLE